MKAKAECPPFASEVVDFLVERPQLPGVVDVQLDVAAAAADPGVQRLLVRTLEDQGLGVLEQLDELIGGRVAVSAVSPGRPREPAVRGLLTFGRSPAVISKGWRSRSRRFAIVPAGSSSG